MNNLAEQILYEDKGGKNLHLEHIEDEIRKDFSFSQDLVDSCQETLSSNDKFKRLGQFSDFKV